VSTSDGSPATIFVQSADVPGLDSSGRERSRDVPAVSAVSYLSGEEQAVVAGSDVIAFAKDVTPDQRQAVVHASVLAQLVAKQKMPAPQNVENVVQWYAAYFDTLSSIGFSAQARGFAQYHDKADTLEIGDAILRVATAALSREPALAIVAKTLDSLRKMSPESAAISVLDRESRSGATARIQMMLVEHDGDAPLTMRMMAFAIETASKVTKLLFFTFKSNDVKVLHHSSTVLIDPAALARIQDAVAEKVKPYAGSFIVGLRSLTQSPADDWLSMAPGPRPLAEGQRWHVYISYRSVNRPWVLQLYDVLRSLEYEVFMDQFVLAPGADLQRSHEDGVRQSAGAVLVWSSQSQESDWIRWETQSFQMRPKEDERFRFVVVRLDRTPLPVQLEQRVWVDFSDFREGPTGTPLLQLLYGLRGEPLPREAVSRAAQLDAETHDLLARIQAARSVGDAERLSALANSDARAWHASPVPLCQVAEALIALRQTERALAVISECRRRFPKALRPQQLHALALTRSGDWREAQLLLEELYSRGERDPETLGILARTWSDRYMATREREFLLRSRDLYAEAFEVNPDDYYVGINAASKSVMLGDLRTCARPRQTRLVTGRFRAQP